MATCRAVTGSPFFPRPVSVNLMQHSPGNEITAGEARYFMAAQYQTMRKKRERESYESTLVKDYTQFNLSAEVKGHGGDRFSEWAERCHTECYISLSQFL